MPWAVLLHKQLVSVSANSDSWPILCLALCNEVWILSSLSGVVEPQSGESPGLLYQFLNSL